MTTESNITYNEAMAKVRAIVKASGTSFASGMSILPMPRREAMYALYAFCRVVDDIADDSPSAEVREVGLKIWHENIAALFKDGTYNGPITRALLPAIERFDLVEKDFQDIIDGMDMDAKETIFAPSMDYLDGYCDLVASAVGRASVRIFGDSSSDAQDVAHHLGRALQLTNIMRDLAEDAQRDRLYLPKELLEKHGVNDKSADEVLKNPNLPAVCKELSLTAITHFEKASESMEKCNWHAMRPARMMRDYYRAILNELLKKDWQDPYKRVSLPFYMKLWFGVRGLIGS